MLDTLVAAVTPELADAVATALALDPRDRYATALEMGHALGNGAKGIPVAGRAPGARGSSRTQATTVLAGARRSGSPAPTVAARRPRQGPPRAGAAPVQAAGRAQAAPRRRSSRLLVALLVMLVLALVVVAAVVLTAPSPTKVVLRNVVYSDVQQTSSALKQLVSENTQ